MTSKQKKTGTNFMYLSQFDKVFLVSLDCMSFLTHVSAQNFQSENFERAKEFAFRKSGAWINFLDIFPISYAESILNDSLYIC